ncbi:MAG: TerD family protein [Mycobacterium sp.]
MSVLIAGQNIDWAPQVVEFRPPTDVTLIAALALNEQGRAEPADGLVVEGRPVSAGITLQDRVLRVDLDGLGVSTHRVLCIAYTDGRRPTAYDCAIGDVNFAVTDPFAATICFEIYRRGTKWKLRAVGQGYAGGLSELLVAHGLTNSAMPVAPGPPAAAPQPLPSEPLSGPTAEPLQRVRMIYEDAARITAAFLSAQEYASSRLDDELSQAVGDPATRNTAAGNAATAAAHKRHDDLIARARIDYDRDATHLINELRELDDNLPPSMASWKSSAWRRSPEPSDAVRLGSLSVTELGPLTIPVCVPSPLRRPIWVDANDSRAALSAVTALVLRLLAASPHPAPSLDVIDLAGGLRPMWESLAGRMIRPVVSDPADIAPRLKELVTATDIAEMRLSVADERSPASVVVFSDFGFGLPPASLDDVIALAAKSGLGTSLVLVGENNWEGADSRLRDLAEFSQHVTLIDGVMLDPWTQNPWNFTVDTAPESGRTLSDLLTSMTALPPLERGLS